jgi:hypothetical protein
VKAGRLLWSANSTALHGRLCQLMSVLTYDYHKIEKTQNIKTH